MNIQILQLKTALAEAKKDLNETEIKIKRCFYELNSYSNPYFKSGNDIKAAEIEQVGNELLKLKNELIKLENTVLDLKNQLGEG